MPRWVFVEIGGSSAQSSVEAQGGFQFSDGVRREPGARYALAVPGVIRPPEVLYASNLGWPDVADPAHELDLHPIGVLVNDAVAAGLGEAVLRSGEGAQPPDLLYTALGTGVGTALVRNGSAVDADMGHIPVGGRNFCEGCRSHGCLNSTIEAKRLSYPVTAEEVDFVVSMLLEALEGMRARGPLPSLLVLAGGITRSTPELIDRLAARTVPDLTVEPTAAAREAKSAAYAGLSRLAHEADRQGKEPIDD
ncbi:ROK family protein [Saccharopolyspora taberi]|uniref:ROK family protein n=1 Tax=Saccharopolyspora taberi TaxID=60895 RepID=A0ABN3VEW5_9PSEU